MKFRLVIHLKPFETHSNEHLVQTAQHGRIFFIMTSKKVQFIKILNGNSLLGVRLNCIVRRIVILSKLLTNPQSKSSSFIRKLIFYR